MGLISSMIEELANNISYALMQNQLRYPPKNALARSRYETRDYQRRGWKTMENRTIPVGP